MDTSAIHVVRKHALRAQESNPVRSWKRRSDVVDALIGRVHAVRDKQRPQFGELDSHHVSAATCRHTGARCWCSVRPSRDSSYRASRPCSARRRVSVLEHPC